MSVSIQRHRPYQDQHILFLVGPGGVGKSSLGSLLAPRLRRELLDLDLIFCERIGIIGPYIAEHGYEAYRAANLALAERLIETQRHKAVFVTASGFLAAAPATQDRLRAQSLLRLGYCLTLLPSIDLDEATQIVVARQLSRPFGFARESEDQKFRARFGPCRDAADMLVVSQATPGVIADAVADALA